MTPDFNAADNSTWPATLTAEHLAPIYNRSVGAIKKSCQLRTFHPAPFLNRPWRWRKVEILRHVEGHRMAPSLVRRTV